MSKLVSNLNKVSHKANGSFKTRSDRTLHLSRFAEFLRRVNVNIERVEHIRAKHIKAYVASCIEKGKGVRAICNEMASIRKILIEAGRHQLANDPSLTNKALGIVGGSRKGTKLPIHNDEFTKALGLAKAKDEGFAACLLLSRGLGLRAEEAVQSCKSLNTWKQALEDGKEKVEIIFGTKGGRLRQTTIHNLAFVWDAVNFSLKIASERNGKLIDKPNMKSAMHYFHNTARSIGLVSKSSPHSLRYAYANDGYNAYLSKGYSITEAIAMVSCDLGHGPSRGRYTRMVYRQPTSELQAGSKVSSVDGAIQLISTSCVF
jgi:hypothetical protein